PHRYMRLDRFLVNHPAQQLSATVCNVTDASSRWPSRTRCTTTIHSVLSSALPSWNAGPAEDRSRQVTGGVKILAHFVARAGPAVTNVAVAVREGEHGADFGGEGTVLTIASGVGLVVCAPSAMS